MSQIQEYNLRDLTARWRDDSGAREAMRLVDKLDGRELEHLLRDHRREEIDDAETYQRDAFDNLLSFYGLIEVAALIGFIPEPLPAEFRTEGLQYLRNRAVERYYQDYYPLTLPELAALRMEERRSFQIHSAEPLVPLFMQFLELSGIVERDEDVGTFLWFLEDGYIGEYGLGHIIRALEKPDKYFAALLRPAEKQTPADQSIHGFRKFVAFMREFDDLLLATDAFPILQSAFWHHHAYWFRLLTDDFGSHLSLTLSLVGTWKSDEDAEKQQGDGDELSSVLASVRRLGSDDYAKAIMRTMPQLKS